MKAGWKTVKLGHIGVHVKGSSMPAKESRFESWSVPSFETGQPEIVSGSSILAAKTPVEVGDVLICKINPRINRVWRVTETGNNLPRICSTEWVVFRANNPSEVLPQWVQIYCSSPAFREWITGQITGTTGSHARAKPSNIFDQEIPLPPLAEQKRIVALLDEAFAGIGEAMAKAEANLMSSKKAFLSILEAALNPVVGRWAEEKLGDLCTIKGRIGYRGYTKNDLVEKGQGAITLSPSNIQENRFVADDCTYISWFKYNESPEIMVFDGDILFVKTGSTYGKVAVAKDLPEKATINPQFVVLKEIRCNNWFLYYSMTSSSFREKVEGIVGGAATPTLSQANLGKLTVNVPHIRTQESIVKQLDEVHHATVALGATYEERVRALRELRVSILAQAFTGELTA
jgi:restriction endonuclease S subunit